MGRRLGVLLMALLQMVPSVALADEPADLKRKIVMDQQRLVVMENLEFSAEEAEKFWPIYQKYQEKLFANTKQHGELLAAYVNVYKSMTDTEALTLVDEYYQLQEEQMTIMKQFIDDLKVILPGQKVLRYMQVENRLAAVSRFELTKRIPMAAQ